MRPGASNMRRLTFLFPVGQMNMEGGEQRMNKLLSFRNACLIPTPGQSDSDTQVKHIQL